MWRLRRQLSLEAHQRAGLTSRSYSERVYEVACYRYGYQSPRLSAKVRAVISSAWGAALGKRILFFPEEPRPDAMLFKALLYAGHRVVSDPTQPHDAAIKWWDDTFTPNSSLPAAFVARRPINIDCEDISKSRVDRVFADVFGYTITVDPTRHRGPYVEKSNLNGQHDGRILEGPIESPRADRVYQKLVNNLVNDSTVEDIRVPVFAGTIPFVYVRTRPVDSRFGTVSKTARMIETHEAFSAVEATQILEFTRRMRLDYGDLDVLRDRTDGRLYIVDANPTPWSGSLKALTPPQRIIALKRTARVFEAMLTRLSRSRTADAPSDQSVENSEYTSVDSRHEPH